MSADVNGGGIGELLPTEDVRIDFSSEINLNNSRTTLFEVV
jgi:hypothetical protein